MLSIEDSSEIQEKQILTGFSKAAVSALSADDQERFQERVGIHECCGGGKKRS